MTTNILLYRTPARRWLLAAALAVSLFSFSPVDGGTGEPPCDEQAARLREIAECQRLIDAAWLRFAHWSAFSERMEVEKATAVVGLFTLAEKSEKVLLYYLNRRIRALGGQPEKPPVLFYSACYASDSAILTAIQIISDTINLPPPDTFARAPFDGASSEWASGGDASYTVALDSLKQARLAVRARPRILRWLQVRLRKLLKKPADLNWWSREYFLCSLCGMPSEDLRLQRCPCCGAPAIELLRVR